MIAAVVLLVVFVLLAAAVHVAQRSPVDALAAAIDERLPRWLRTNEPTDPQDPRHIAAVLGIVRGLGPGDSV